MVLLIENSKGRLCFFKKYNEFCLIYRRGEFRKSVMMIKDSPTSSTPDLRMSLSTSPPPSLVVVDVVEVSELFP